MPTSFESAILADAPKHWWRFLEPRGGATFDFGSTPLPMVSGHPYIMGGGMGWSGPDSSSGAILNDVADSSFSQVGQISIAQPFTMEIWCWNLNGSGLGTLQWRVDPNAGPTTGLQLSPSGAVFLNNGVSVGASYGTSLGQWHQVVGRDDGVNTSIFIDGASVASAASSGSASGSQSHFTPTSPIPCIVSELLFWNVALGSSRISAHYSAASQKSRTPTQSAGAAGPLVDARIDAILAAVIKNLPSLP
jgi:hypothetical protein